jgi:Protein of unknown function (DUF3450)
MTHRMITSGFALLVALSALPLAAAAEDAKEGAQNAAPAPPPGPTEAEKQAIKLAAAVDEQKAADADSKASQAKIDKLDDETQKLLAEYRKAVADAQSYNDYAKQLQVQVASQNQEMADINAQLLEVETTSREVSPLMQNMLATLDQFVSLDVPFLLEERQGRVATLKNMMDQANVTISEKYRRIVEAYVVEMEYGRTIEAYEDKLGGGDDRTVQLLRIGRVTLLYQTMDGKETGYWDADKKAWVVNNDYQHAFREGVHVAKKMGAPDILLAPIQAPKEDS